MLLRHRILGAIKAIEDELPKERETDLAVEFHVLLTLAVDQVEVVAFRLAGHVDIFAQFDVTGRPKDECPSVSPGAQRGGREPIDPEMVGRAVVAKQRRLPVILELRVFRVPSEWVTRASFAPLK